jgi:hypothetical protein
MIRSRLDHRRLLAVTTLTILLVSVYAPLMRFGVLAADAWADPDCNYRRKLTFGNSASSENFTNFPVLVVLNSSRIDYSKTNATDIRFYDGSTLLKKETELWNSSGSSYIWVKVPQIDNSATDYIYAYYNATSSRNDDDAASVWSDYTMVQHLEETSGTLTDSTANHNDGAAYGVTLNAAGKIDGADDYSGASSYSVINDSTAFNFSTNSFSYLFWFKSRATTTQYLFSKKQGTLGQTSAGYMMGISSDVNLGYSVALGNGSTNVRINTGNHSSRGGNVWTMFAVVVDRTQQNMTVYIDGVLKGNASISSTFGSVDNNMNFTLGKQADLAGSYFNGALDEVCVLNASRSASWVKAQYLSTSDQFITYGSEETPSGTTPLVLTVTSPLNLTTYYDTTVTLSGSTNLNANVTYKLDSQADVSVSNGTQTYSTSLTGLSYGSHAVTVNAVETGNPTNTNSSIVYFSVQPVPWADPACHYRARLTFKNSASSENLTNFPVLVVLNSARIDYSKTSATDIRFYDWGTLLSKETELWNPSGNSYIWVKVPQIDNTDKDYIYAYYNCSSSSNLDDAASVWSDYAMVQHLEETSGTLTDSTSNHNDGTPTGVELNAQGKIDGGDNYTGSSYSVISDSASLNFGTNSFSYSFWFNTTKTLVTQDILDKKGGTQGVGPAGYKMTISSVQATGLSASVSDGTNSIRLDTGTVPEWNGNVWAMFTVVVNRTSQLMLSYINGVQKGSASIATVGSVGNSLNLRLGNDTGGTLLRGYYGGLDEVRICSGSRSASWTYADYLSTSDQFITFGSEEFHNDAPNKPSNPSPSNGASGVPTSTTLSVTVTDPQGDPMNVSFYQLAPSPPENFTIIVLPDTQYYSSSYPQIFDNQTQWAVNNAAGLSIVFVTHEGDLIDGYDVPSDWNNANHSMSLLDSHIPWAIAPGNHDVNDIGNTTNFNIYFGTSRFTGKSWYGGAYNNDNANSFELFTQGTDKYLIFHIQYDPPDAALTWANQTIANYPDRRVIVTTHEYLSGGSRTSIGENIWQKFVRPHADQIFLVLSGHSSRESRRSDTVNSHTVYQVEADYQGDSNGGNGWLRLLEFHPLEDKIYVKTFSPYLNSYETDSDSQFTLDYNMTGTSTTPTLIGTALNVASGGVASIPWNGLSYSTTYQWYAVANDTSGATNQSDTWSFTTTTQATYTLTVSTVGSGSVTLNNTGPYYYGDVVQLAAVPAGGWSFQSWSGDLLGSVSPTTILINGNKTVTATFTQNTYTLSVSTVGSGSVNLNNTGPYYYGDVVQLAAVPAGGWSFNLWSGDLLGSDNPATLTITDNMSVTAHFVVSGKPTLNVDPESKTCRMFNETFTVQITITNASDVEDFEFEIHYNATLLDVVGIQWNAWESGTYTADEVNGILTGYTSGSAKSGGFTLLTITFNATYHHIWKDESTVSGWKNIQTGTVYIQWANLSYPTGPDLGYVRGGLNQINVGSDFAYTFSSIQGDVDNSGVVDVTDLRTVASFYDTSSPEYNLTGDNTIDIFDLVVVGANFGYTYSP